MDGKKAGTRFSIQFNRANPDHCQVADLLNRQKRYDKAQYIVNAVLHFENCGLTPDTQRSSRIDERAIEAIVKRLLSEREIVGVDQPVSAAENQPENTLLSSEEINFDDALEAIGGDGFSAIADALEMFRSK
ncbi:MAG: hypothetical protein FWF13_07115 [Acidobacteria bacterium]|nr:hypothetical protein [Acidobacteriota bacterium]